MHVVWYLIGGLPAAVGIVCLLVAAGSDGPGRFPLALAGVGFLLAAIVPLTIGRALTLLMHIRDTLRGMAQAARRRDELEERRTGTSAGTKAEQQRRKKLRELSGGRG